MSLPNEPIGREETYLAKIAGQDVELPSAPIGRIETYLAKIAGQNVDLPPAPISRKEQYLAYIAGNTNDAYEIVPITLDEDSKTIEIPFTRTKRIRSIMCVCDEQNQTQTYAFHDWTAIYIYGQDTYTSVNTRNGYNPTPLYAGQDKVSISVDYDLKIITASIAQEEYIFSKKFKYTIYLFYGTDDPE